MKGALPLQIGKVGDDERVALTESEMEALEPPTNALGDLRDGVSSTAPTSTLNALDAVQRVRGFKQELGHILAELDLTRQQTALVREALDSMVRERSGGSGPAVLTAPINIGIGTK